MSIRTALMEMAQNQSEAVAYNTKAAKSRLDDRRETNSRMLKRDFNKSGISHIHSTKTGPDGSKHDHFDIGKHTKVISTHNSYKVLHKGKETHFQGDPEHRDNRNRVIDKVLQHVGKNESVERAAWVPESILDDDVSHFMGAAAAAKKAGKSHFDFGGKKYKATMKHDTAKKVDESAGCAECGPDGECQCEQPVEEAKVDELSTKTMKSYAKKASKQRDKAGDSYSNAARRRHDFAPDTPAMKKNAIKYKKRDSGVDMAQKKLAARDRIANKESVEEAAGTAQHRPTKATSDTFDKQMNNGEGSIPMGKKKDFVNMHNMEVALDAEEIYKKNKYEALSKTPARPGDQTAGDTKPVNPIPANPIDGMRAALAKMKLSGE